MMESLKKFLFSFLKNLFGFFIIIGLILLTIGGVFYLITLISPVLSPIIAAPILIICILALLKTCEDMAEK